MALDRLFQLFERLTAYPWWQVSLELLLIGLLVYAVARFVQGTRAAGALKGLFLLVIVGALVVRIFGQREAFQRLTFLIDHFLALAAVALIVIFQPELRRGLTRLGETPIFRRSPKPISAVADAVADAAAWLSKARFGAIVVLQREAPLKGLTEGGTVLNADVSARLLQTIFYPGSPLHDLAVVIADGRVIAAGVQLPLAEPSAMPDPTLGSRHRAAVGISAECDALVVVVSEETGMISLAESGRLMRQIPVDELADVLIAKMRTRRGPAAAGAAPLAEEPPHDADGSADQAESGGSGRNGLVAGSRENGTGDTTTTASRAGPT